MTDLPFTHVVVGKFNDDAALTPRPSHRIRVVRVLEYTYETLEEYERDRANWAVQGVRAFNPRCTIRSAVLPLETLATDESPPQLLPPDTSAVWMAPVATPDRVSFDVVLHGYPFGQRVVVRGLDSGWSTPVGWSRDSDSQASKVLDRYDLQAGRVRFFYGPVADPDA